MNLVVIELSRTATTNNILQSQWM